MELDKDLANKFFGYLSGCDCGLKIRCDFELGLAKNKVVIVGLGGHG